MFQVDVLTIFPAMFDSPFAEGIVSRAKDKGLVEIRVHNLRDFTSDKHAMVDDYPFGGGPGMLMKPAPFFEGVDFIRKTYPGAIESRIVLLTPQGKTFQHEVALEFYRSKGLILLCGRYEGVDDRVADYLADEQVGIGDYILSGGELAAMVIIECVVRLLPGALGSSESLVGESFSEGLLKYPQYTRPALYRGMEVPSILLSGDHAKIAEWRREQSRLRTSQRRPEMLAESLKEGKEQVKKLEKG